ncbi:MAG: BLUF domain-containing protein [Alphaproteobacteria bacterium]|nr:BLUF domain-containing protein [Alphaproteobacteria bacterium]
MEIAHLVYVSTAPETPDADMLQEILREARLKNAETEITGLLFSVGRHFMQLLEGSEAAVNDTFERIRHDPRHSDIMIIHTETTSERVFPDWSMGFAVEDLPVLTPASSWIGARPQRLQALLPTELDPHIRMLFMSFRGADEIQLASAQ